MNSICTRALSLAAGMSLAMACSNNGESGAADLDDATITARDAMIIEWFGTVRHFHPSEAVEYAPWDNLILKAFAHARQIEDAGALINTLDGMLSPLGTGLAVVPHDEDPDTSVPACDGEDPIRWVHIGFNGQPSVDPDATGIFLSSERKPWDQALTGVHHSELPQLATISLKDGQQARIPLALCPNEAASDQPSPMPFTPSLSWPETARLALANIWSVMDHFYPYPDVIKGEWHDVLIDRLNAASDVTSQDDLMTFLQRLGEPLNDAHIMVYEASDTFERYYLPITIHWEDDQAVVVASNDPDSVPVGSRIESVNGEAILDWRDNEEGLISGGAHIKRHLSASRLTRGLMGETATLEWSDGEATHAVGLSYTEDRIPDPLERDPIDWLDDDVVYIDLRALALETFLNEVDSIAESEYMVVDLRGYPLDALGFNILLHLMEEPSDWHAWIRTMAARGPGGNLIPATQNDWTPLEPQSPRITADVALLINAGAASYAESVIGMFQRHELGVTVGSTTAGTNGSVQTLAASDNLLMRFTAQNVLGPNDETYQGIGLVPDVEVLPTADDLAERHDAVLHAALEELGLDADIITRD